MNSSRQDFGDFGCFTGQCRGVHEIARLQRLVGLLDEAFCHLVLLPQIRGEGPVIDTLQIGRCARKPITDPALGN